MPLLWAAHDAHLPTEESSIHQHIYMYYHLSTYQYRGVSNITAASKVILKSLCECVTMLYEHIYCVEQHGNQQFIILRAVL